MATILLQVAGSAIGGAMGGPIGAAIGGAIGGSIGYSIDQSIFSKDQVVTGPRLEKASFLASTPGAAIPKVYGRARVGGQIIWATRFEEIVSTEKRGGKGGGGSKTTVKQYSYLGNFAIGICQGEVSCIRRIWADGEELDLTKLEMRIYTGSEIQEADPLIEAKQGLNNTPAYKGLCYVVFEGFQLEQYGNRIPQFSFEVVCSINRLDKEIRSVNLIPGSGEYAYEPSNFTVASRGNVLATNRHNLIAGSDWKASLDELQALCPNLKSVSLVVSWFGDSLDAAQCQIEPKISATTDPRATWMVGGISRAQANKISLIDGKSAFGGTPSDQSVLNAIADLKSRGLEVVLYPFVMMDIPVDNVLDNPWFERDGASTQKPYPWRGEITCNPAPETTDTPDQPGTPDKSAAINAIVSSFVGQASATDFAPYGQSVKYTDPQNATNEWSYRRFILHYAKLAERAGGVSGIVIGSELRSLTRLRNADNEFVFVSELVKLAEEVRTVLGDNCSITYAADWSEYFGFHPTDGSNDLYFHLDPLWASPAIDAIGIDNYMPLADWHENGDPEAPGRGSIADIDYLKSSIAGEEGFNWYYASEADRQAGNRSLITDGEGEEWVWRYKDIVSWWSNPHYERLAGVKSETQTSWVPKSKPIWFTELGCPAVDRGPNQPNLFPDAKNDLTLPHYSSGARDDLVQIRFLLAHYEYWTQNRGEPENPISPIYGGPMVSPDHITPWAWDTRPFPCFPLQTDVWSDGDNWQTGHWLNGRLGACPLDDLINAILSDYSDVTATINVDGFVDGYVLPDAISARAAIEPLVGAFSLVVSEDGEGFKISSVAYADIVELGDRAMVEAEKGHAYPTLTVAEESSLPYEIVVSSTDIFSNYRTDKALSRQLGTLTKRQQTVDLPAIMAADHARQLAENLLHTAWTGRRHLEFSCSYAKTEISIGDIIEFSDDLGQQYPGRWLVENINSAAYRTIKARSVDLLPASGQSAGLLPTISATNLDYVAPQVHYLDIPSLTGDYDSILLVAASSIPWNREYALLSSPDHSGYQSRGSLALQASLGSTLTPLNQGVSGRWDYSQTLDIELDFGTLSSETRLQVLAGQNAIAVQNSMAETAGSWEVIQFRYAEIVGDKIWRLSGLLRGQLGTEPQMVDQKPIGSPVVVLNEAISSVSMANSETGLPLNWLCGPAGEAHASSTYTRSQVTFKNIAAQPLSPCHLKWQTSVDGLLEMSWIRRTRINGDSWENEDVPLGEETEKYRLSLTSSSGQTLIAETDQPAWSQSVSEITQQLGNGDVLDVEISQIGTGGRVGKPLSQTINL